MANVRRDFRAVLPKVDGLSPKDWTPRVYLAVGIDCEGTVFDRGAEPWPASRKNSMRRPETIQTAMFMPQPPGWRAVA